jgi:diacylglycerol kinase family enzyme
LPLPIQADGEIIGDTPIQIEVVADAIKVIVPAPMPQAAAIDQEAALVDA